MKWPNLSVEIRGVNPTIRGPTDYKNAIETQFKAILRPQKSMGGIVIDIWEKSNFFGSFGSQKGAKNTTFVQGGL